jgi:hypothetical protein
MQSYPIPQYIQQNKILIISIFILTDGISAPVARFEAIEACARPPRLPLEARGRWGRLSREVHRERGRRCPDCVVACPIAYVSPGRRASLSVAGILLRLLHLRVLVHGRCEVPLVALRPLRLHKRCHGGLSLPLDLQQEQPVREESPCLD